MSPVILPLSSYSDVQQPPSPATLSRNPSFGTSVPDRMAQAELIGLARRVQGSKRVVIICGAGVSTAADIPDFRSASGIYGPSSFALSTDPTAHVPSPAKRARTISRSNGPTVRDLFHVDALKGDTLRPAQHALFTDLYERSTSAQPTAFHSYLARLEREGRLLRCYTQNIDGLEGKAGLSVGVPEKPMRGRKKRKVEMEVVVGKVMPDTQGERRVGSPASQSTLETIREAVLPANEIMCDPARPACIPGPPVTPVKNYSTGLMPTPPSSHTSSLPSPSPIHSPSLPLESALPAIPRVIPLHGILSTLRCTFCSYTCPMADRAPLVGDPMPCPSCWEWAIVRSALSERQRPSGFLRPDIVLYGEEHPQGHLIGDVVEKDLKGLARAPTQAAVQGQGQGRGKKKEGKADLLIVTGTSLSIPGVKRIVKEFAKSITGTSATRRTMRESKWDTPRTPSKTRTPQTKGRGKGQVVFVNQEPPSKSAEWEDVFDYWVKGDVQTFVKEYLEVEYASDVLAMARTGFTTPPKTPKTPKTPRKRAVAPGASIRGKETPRTTPKTKRIHISDGSAYVPSTPSLAMSIQEESASRSDSSSFTLDTPTRPKSHRTSGISDDKIWTHSPFDNTQLTIRPTKKRKQSQRGLRDADDVFTAGVGAVSRKDGDVQPKEEMLRVAVGRKESLTPLPDDYGGLY